MWKILIVISLLAAATLPIQASTDDNSVTLSRPPASLAQWYKPLNKRNVWHHNMFKLRRELQAVTEYMADNDRVHVEKWALQLIEHYRKIADMVPEWEDELELEWAEKLEVAAREGDFTQLRHAIKKVQTSCKGCHSDYRAQVAAIYRAPDFSSIQVSLDEQALSYADFMKQLMRDINRIKIAADDGNHQKAQTALRSVRKGISALRASCSNCHKHPAARDYYLGAKTEILLDTLEEDITNGKPGHALGQLAVQTCAACHGSHRIVYDLKREIE